MIPVTSTITLTDTAVSKPVPLASSKKRVQSLFFSSNRLSKQINIETTTMTQSTEQLSPSSYTTDVPSAPLNKLQGLWRPPPPLSPTLVPQSSVQAWLEDDTEELDLPVPMTLDSVSDSSFSSSSSPSTPESWEETVIESKQDKLNGPGLVYNVRQSAIQAIAAKPSKHAFFTKTAYYQFSVQSTETSFKNNQL
jgi:hypothetical protein